MKKCSFCSKLIMTKSSRHKNDTRLIKPLNERLIVKDDEDYICESYRN